MPDDPVCRRVIYRGRVQGVGFRFTTHRIAQRHPVRGFVRNLPDGTVELVAAGSSAAVRRFLDDVSQAMHGNIATADACDWSDDCAGSGFEIRG